MVCSHIDSTTSKIVCRTLNQCVCVCVFSFLLLYFWMRNVWSEHLIIHNWISVKQRQCSYLYFVHIATTFTFLFTVTILYVSRCRRYCWLDTKWGVVVPLSSLKSVRFFNFSGMWNMFAFRYEMKRWIDELENWRSSGLCAFCCNMISPNQHIVVECVLLDIFIRS